MSVSVSVTHLVALIVSVTVDISFGRPQCVCCVVCCVDISFGRPQCVCHCLLCLPLALCAYSCAEGVARVRIEGLKKNRVGIEDLKFGRE